MKRPSLLPYTCFLDAMYSLRRGQKPHFPQGKPMLGGICSTYLFLTGFAIPISGGECPLPGLSLGYNMPRRNESIQALWGLRQSPLAPWSNETEKDEDQGKAESSIRHAAEVEICYCFVLHLIKKLKKPIGEYRATSDQCLWGNSH